MGRHVNFCLPLLLSPDGSRGKPAWFQFERIGEASHPGPEVPVSDELFLAAAAQLYTVEDVDVHENMFFHLFCTLRTSLRGIDGNTWTGCC